MDPATTVRVFGDFLESESKPPSRVSYFALVTSTKTPVLTHRPRAGQIAIWYSEILAHRGVRPSKLRKNHRPPMSHSQLFSMWQNFLSWEIKCHSDALESSSDITTFAHMSIQVRKH